MRKVILFIATSLDGYIAGASDNIDWLFTDQDYGYTDFYRNIDTVLMGRRTYEVSLSLGEYPYEGTQGFVFSRTLTGDRPSHPHPVQFVSGDVAQFIQQLKHQLGKDIWLVGGAAIIQLCLEYDLIDEFVISVHPILLGEGIALWRSPFTARSLQLQKYQSFKTGLVQLTYSRHFTSG